jgi:hypothetical protein
MTDTQTSPDTTAEKDAPPAVELPWADVSVEHHKMLRLAPLQTDRTPAAGRCALSSSAMPSATQRAQPDAHGNQTARPARAQRAEPSGCVGRPHQQACAFRPDSGLQIEPLNRGIGRFLAAQGINWAKTLARLHRRRHGPEQQGRAERRHPPASRPLLARARFDVVYADAQHLKGSVKEVQVGDLLGDWNSEKLQIVEILEAAQMLQQAEQNLAEQEVKLKKQEEKVSKFKREDAGLRFTITCLVAFAVFQAGLLIWIATHR